MEKRACESEKDLTFKGLCGGGDGGQGIVWGEGYVAGYGGGMIGDGYDGDRVWWGMDMVGDGYGGGYDGVRGMVGTGYGWGYGGKAMLQTSLFSSSRSWNVCLGQIKQLRPHNHITFLILQDFILKFLIVQYLKRWSR